MGIVNIKKSYMEYRLEGIGPMVVVLKGGHCSRDTNLSHEKLKDCGFSVLIPSRPGYDRTSSEIGRTAEESADAIAALLDILLIDKIILIAISAAGPTALAFCLKYPNCVKKLIMECAMAKGWDEKYKKTATKVLFGPAEKVTWWITFRLLFSQSVLAFLQRCINNPPKQQMTKYHYALPNSSISQVYIYHYTEKNLVYSVGS